jgi:hypothetical protein
MVWGEGAGIDACTTDGRVRCASGVVTARHCLAGVAETRAHAASRRNITARHQLAMPGLCDSKGTCNLTPR